MTAKSLDGIVRRRNTQGKTTVALSITVPIELNDTLEKLMKSQNESKSLVATILMEEALIQRDARKG